MKVKAPVTVNMRIDVQMIQKIQKIRFLTFSRIGYDDSGKAQGVLPGKSPGCFTGEKPRVFYRGKAQGVLPGQSPGCFTGAKPRVFYTPKVL